MAERHRTWGKGGPHDERGSTNYITAAPRGPRPTRSGPRTCSTPTSGRRRPGGSTYPADIASALLFLVSPLSQQITGEALVVDGGNMVLFNVDAPTP